jgi:hypothetical protein
MLRRQRADLEVAIERGTDSWGPDLFYVSGKLGILIIER